MPLRKKTPPPSEMAFKKSDPELGEKERKSRWNLFSKDKERERERSKSNKRKSQDVEGSGIILNRDSGYGESEQPNSETSTNANSFLNASGVASQNSAVSPLSGPGGHAAPGPMVSQETHHDATTGTTITTTTTTTTTTVTTTGPGGTHTIAMPNNQVPHSNTVQSIHPPSPAAIAPRHDSAQGQLEPPANPQRNPSQNGRNVQFLDPGYQAPAHQANTAQSDMHSAPGVYSPLTPPVPLRSGKRNSRDLGYFPGALQQQRSNPDLAQNQTPIPGMVPTQQAPQGRLPVTQPPQRPMSNVNTRLSDIESVSTSTDHHHPHETSRFSAGSCLSHDSDNSNSSSNPSSYLPYNNNNANFPHDQHNSANYNTPVSPIKASRQNFSYPGRAQPVPMQEMPADEVDPSRVEPIRQESQRQRDRGILGKVDSLKGTIAGIHGAGEALRGTVNSTIDRRLNPADTQRHERNQAIIDRGRRELETRKFERASEGRAPLDPNSTAGRFHRMMVERKAKEAESGQVTDGYTVPRKELGVNQ